MKQVNQRTIDMVLARVSERVDKVGPDRACEELFEELCRNQPHLGTHLKKLIQFAPDDIKEHLAPGTTDAHLDVIRGQIMGVVVLVASCYEET